MCVYDALLRSITGVGGLGFTTKYLRLNSAFVEYKPRRKEVRQKGPVSCPLRGRQRFCLDGNLAKGVLLPVCDSAEKVWGWRLAPSTTPAWRLASGTLQESRFGLGALAP